MIPLEKWDRLIGLLVTGGLSSFKRDGFGSPEKPNLKENCPITSLGRKHGGLGAGPHQNKHQLPAGGQRQNT